MTRHEDSRTRRSQVADALLSTVADHGLEATSLRDVAEAAGVSVGLVQRYFRTRAELVRFGAEVMMERTEARVRQVPVKPPYQRAVFEAAANLLPLDQERNAEFRVTLAFFQASLHDAQMATIHAEGMARLIEGFSAAFHLARQAGELRRGDDPASQARGLIAFIDGLSLHAVVTSDAFDAATVVSALEAYLDGVFTERESAS